MTDGSRTLLRLMERYTAFTEWRGWKRCFHVKHKPWPQCEVEAEILDDSLLAIESRDGSAISLSTALASIPAYWLIARRYRRRL